MPRKTDIIPLDHYFLDRRTKLLPCMKERLHDMYEKNGSSIHSLSKTFGVSRRLIQFELFPERKHKNLQDRYERGGSVIYYKGGSEWAETMKEHRDYKKEVFKK